MFSWRCWLERRVAERAFRWVMVMTEGFNLIKFSIASLVVLSIWEKPPVTTTPVDWQRWCDLALKSGSLYNFLLYWCKWKKLTFKLGILWIQKTKRGMQFYPKINYRRKKMRKSKIIKLHKNYWKFSALKLLNCTDYYKNGNKR